MNVAVATEPNVLRVDETGTIRIGSTRVTLETLVAAFNSGATPQQIVENYPSLALAEVYAAIGAYLRQRAALDDYLAKCQNEAKAFQVDNSHLYATDVKNRLRARLGKDAHE